MSDQVKIESSGFSYLDALNKLQRTHQPQIGIYFQETFNGKFEGCRVEASGHRVRVFDTLDQTLSYVAELFEEAKNAQAYRKTGEGS